ncbi:TatD family hydrolase [Taylorella equigenitalis]|uniref:TatD family hydrolase n=1 Tax=Taylorella equigenitalis TaxID=29575 RepID=UPI0004170E8F|nr:TatD family hydrolase [Taylorella equigenitalis]WDU46973.1 TatD family hydrolase [Taylorella equigenitalis]
MFIDTHCHLDALDFKQDLQNVISRAQDNGVLKIIIPAINTSNYAIVEEIASGFEGGYFCLGMHPMYLEGASINDLQFLEKILREKKNPKLIGIGEIGLDYFVDSLQAPEQIEKQEFYFVEQLKLAKKFKLPVVLHVRKSVDRVYKFLNQIGGLKGIAHAFNGSEQQAKKFIDLGFCLGFGGNITYERALQIRRLAKLVPIENIVLETDSPDIAPSWIYKQRNEPYHLRQIAQVLADLREINLEELAEVTSANAARIFNCPQFQYYAH